MLFGKMVVMTFVFLCSLGIFSVLWTIFFMIKMSFEISDKRDVFSRRTIWNPLNTIFFPNILNENGLKSRRNIFRGLILFLISFAGAAGVGALVYLTN